LVSWALVDKYLERQLDRLMGWLRSPQRLVVVKLGAGCHGSA